MIFGLYRFSCINRVIIEISCVENRWDSRIYLPFVLCKRRPTAGHREDARRDDREDTGRISRFCKGRNRESPLHHCDRCRSAYPQVETPCSHLIASCLSVVPGYALPVGLSSDDKIPCRRRSIKPGRRIVEFWSEMLKRNIKILKKTLISIFDTPIFVISIRMSREKKLSL